MFPSVSQLQEDLNGFTDVFGDEIVEENLSQPLSFPTMCETLPESLTTNCTKINRPLKHTGQHGEFRSVEEIDPKYRCLFTYPYFNLVQSRIIEDALYSDKSMVVCAPTGSGKTVVFELAILQLLMAMEDAQCSTDFKIIYMAPVKAVCNERLTEWYPKLTKLGLLCVEVTGDTEVDFAQLKPYRVIITTPEKWDMLTRRWRDHRGLVEMIKLFLIDEVHILNDETRGPVLETVVSRMKTVESAAQSAHRIEQLQRQYHGTENCTFSAPPHIRFVAVSATVSNPDDVADWLGTSEKPAVFHKFGDECRPVKLQRIVEGYHCAEGTSIFKFDLILNYKLWPIIQKYYNGKPTLIFCNTRKSVTLTAESLSREVTVSFSPEQKAKLTALASTIKNKKLQMLIMSGVGCHHAGMLYEERVKIEQAFRNRDLPILITTTTLAMGVNLPAHLVIVKNTQQYVNGAYQEYSISTVLQMVGRAGRPQFDTEATAVIMTRLSDKPRYQALVGGSEPLQSYLHKRIAENLNSEAALGTVSDVAQCVEWLRSTFLYVRAAKDPKRYLGLPPAAPTHLILKKIEELCVKAMNSLASSGLITMDEASCIESTEAGRLMSLFYLDVETMKNIMKIEGSESLERLLWLVCESHELSDMYLRVDERRCLNLLNRNNAAATIRFPMKGKISTRQMKLNCIIQATLGCLPIPDPSLNQEAMKVMKTASRVCKCLVRYVSHPELVSKQPQCFLAVLNSIILSKCIEAHLWENSPYVSKQLKGIGSTFSTLLASAGVSSFMLLEESHPRDLERIMNKGAPAGNIIRKQVSLLPKYQLTVTPKDSRSIKVQLMLLNHAHLCENMNHLTAGENHKSYLVVGDSENNLILLTQFTDNDLINVYDGTMNYEITRKLNSEHKILIHCVSSAIVGIDAQADYLFLDLEPQAPHESNFSVNSDLILPRKNVAGKQTAITDVYKERKRKNTSDNDITQCQEKKKRENALTRKLMALKESFSKSSKVLKKDIDTTAEMSNKLIHDLLDGKNMHRASSQVTKNVAIESPTVDLTKNDLYGTLEGIIISDDDDYVDELQVDSILSKIESEISGNDSTSRKLQSNNVNSIIVHDHDIAVPTLPKTRATHPDQQLETKYKNLNKIPNFVDMATTNICYTSKDTRKRKNINTKSNFNCIDLIEKKANTNDMDNNVDKSNDSGFSDTIKSQIEKFLQRTQNKTKVIKPEIDELLQTSVCDELPEVHIKNSTNTGENTYLEIPEQDTTNSSKSENRNLQRIEVENLGIQQEDIKSELSNLGDENYSCGENQNLPEVYIKTALTLESNGDANIQVHTINKDYTTPDHKNIKYHKTDTCDGFQEISKLKDEKYDDDNIIFITRPNTNQTLNEFTDFNVSSDILAPSSNMNNNFVLPEMPYTRDTNAPVQTSGNKESGTYNNVRESCSHEINAPDINQRNTDFHKSLISYQNKNQTVHNTFDLDMVMEDKSVIRYQDMHKHIPGGIKNYRINSSYPATPRQMAPIHSNVTNFRLLTSNENTSRNYSQPDRISYNMKSIPNSADISNPKYLVNQERHKDYFYNQERHFKKISYTATKVDVCTKTCAPDHELRITRKLKVDVDLEIVKQDRTRTNKEDSNTEHVDLNNKQKNESKNTLYVKARTFCLEDEKHNFKTITQNGDINEIDTDNQRNYDDLREVPSRGIEEKQATNNSIGNILQKYSKILNKRGTNTPMANKINKNTSDNSAVVTKIIEPKSNAVKSRKPFRISEINTLNMPLPDTLINVSGSAPNVTPVKPPTNTIIKNETIQDPEVYDPRSTVINLTPKMRDDSDTSYESPASVHSLQIDSMEDIKDENLFNPKLLLQHFSEDSKQFSDIIPPPAPFSDNIYSPAVLSQNRKLDFHGDDMGDLQNLDKDMENRDKFNSDFDEMQNVESKFNSHIALDSGLQSSPKEIETWCLSRDDEYDAYRSQPVSSSPWIISKQGRSSQVNCSSRDDEYDAYRSQPISTSPWIISKQGHSSQVNANVYSRRANLCKFKFVRKKPLKF